MLIELSSGKWVNPENIILVVSSSDYSNPPPVKLEKGEKYTLIKNARRRIHLFKGQGARRSGRGN